MSTLVESGPATEYLVAHAASLHVRAATLQAELAAEIERSADLRWERRQRRHGQPDTRPIRGGADDVGFIASALADGVKLCADCISTKTGVPLGQVTPLMARIAVLVRIKIDVAPCDACLYARKLYRLGGSRRRSSSPARLPFGRVAQQVRAPAL
jgi:hypothetical protein